MQLTIGLASAGLDSQTAVDVPYLCIVDGTNNSVVSIKRVVHDDIIDKVEAMEHEACDRTPS